MKYNAVSSRKQSETKYPYCRQCSRKRGPTLLLEMSSTSPAAVDEINTSQTRTLTQPSGLLLEERI